MPITYPRDLRALMDTGLVFAEPCSFDLRISAATARLPSITQVMEVAPRIWTATYTTQPLDDIEQRRVAAFLSSLGGPQQFLGYHPLATRPADVLLPETTTATAFTATTITLSIPAGRAVTAGDMIGIEQSGKYGLFRAVETVSSSGGLAVFDVTPTVPAGVFSAGATARFTRPVARMILDPAEPVAMPIASPFAAFSFRALQSGF